MLQFVLQRAQFRIGIERVKLWIHAGDVVKIHHPFAALVVGVMHLRNVEMIDVIRVNICPVAPSRLDYAPRHCAPGDSPRDCAPGVPISGLLRDRDRPRSAPLPVTANEKLPSGWIFREQ